MNSVGAAATCGVVSVTETVTVSVSVPPWPSLTVSWNWSVSTLPGAVNVVTAALLLLSVTVLVPPTCVHAKVNVSPSASELPEPLRVAVLLTVTV